MKKLTIIGSGIYCAFLCNGFEEKRNLKDPQNSTLTRKVSFVPFPWIRHYHDDKKIDEEQYFELLCKNFPNIKVSSNQK
jgi:hypothetical protein